MVDLGLILRAIHPDRVQAAYSGEAVVKVHENLINSIVNSYPHQEVDVK